MFDPAKQKQFDDQRYERLKEIVSEYLDDEGSKSTTFLYDLYKAITENSSYFEGRVAVYDQIKEFFS